MLINEQKQGNPLVRYTPWRFDQISIQDLPSSFPEVGTSVLQLDFLPLGTWAKLQ